MNTGTNSYIDKIVVFRMIVCQERTYYRIVCYLVHAAIGQSAEVSVRHQ